VAQLAFRLVQEAAQHELSIAVIEALVLWSCTGSLRLFGEKMLLACSAVFVYAARGWADLEVVHGRSFLERNAARKKCGEDEMRRGRNAARRRRSYPCEKFVVGEVLFLVYEVTVGGGGIRRLGGRRKNPTTNTYV